MAKNPPTFLASAAAKLSQIWDNLPESPDISAIPNAIQEAITRSVSSKTKTYRYVLPAQLLAKVTDPSLDCRSVQMQSGLTRPFDARSLCHSVIVPFDQSNHAVLGGSTEPYINNPLRIPAITPNALPAQRDKAGFQYLIDVLEYVQNHPEHAERVFEFTLARIRDMLGSARVIYPAPRRLSLKQSLEVIRSFLGERSGGLRMQAVAVALFRTIGASFKLYAEVRSSKVNAADASTGSSADLECVDDEGRVVMGVEVKDRELRVSDLQAKLPAIRERGIAEILFLVQDGEAANDQPQIDQTIDRQFTSGHNIYVTSLTELLRGCMVLFGEGGRREFIRHVGVALDEYSGEISHRRRWAELLSAI
ncbi:MAG TPA: restriction endonuclease, SacI family [Tepidisphaeraceae bacterium]|nr:restriction endonuclease, SacI family [Tepidisphaeraceae bacterium]